jgi:hypothetical protein
MASTFMELFGDFQDSIKSYTEKLDVTKLAFMRLLTRGIQKFNEQCRLVEVLATVSKGTVAPYWPIPTDLLEIKEMRSSTGMSLLEQEFSQWNRNQQLILDGQGYVETPTDYDERYGNNRTTPTRIFTIFRRQFLFYPDVLDTDTFQLFYIPDLHAISQNSIQWAGWFPGTQFDIMFRSARINDTYAPYEDAFVDYAVGQYIKRKGSINYRIFEMEFDKQIQIAKMNAPIMFKEGVRTYEMSPFG